MTVIRHNVTQRDWRRMIVTVIRYNVTQLVTVWVSSTCILNCSAPSHNALVHGREASATRSTTRNSHGWLHYRDPQTVFESHDHRPVRTQQLEGKKVTHKLGSNGEEASPMAYKLMNESS